jgi:hypothetical protein
MAMAKKKTEMEWINLMRRIQIATAQTITVILTADAVARRNTFLFVQEIFLVTLDGPVPPILAGSFAMPHCNGAGMVPSN